MKTATSIPDLIDKLGGTGEAAKALGAKQPSVVSMWIKRQQIPPRHYPRHAEVLRERGITAPESFWFGAAQ